MPGIFLIDYLQGTLGYRLKPERVLHEPLAKVINIMNPPAWVIDATGGLGKDAMMMAMMGCKVWMCEAHPLLYPLIQDALQRALHDPYFKQLLTQPDNFQFFPEDAGTILTQLLALPPANRPDIIYLDPMFPSRKKSSLVKKDMQWLKAIHETPEENLNNNNNFNFNFQYPAFTTATDLLELALQVATKRVVVKRPLHAPALSNAMNHTTSPPSFSKLFQSARFDVYLRSI